LKKIFFVINCKISINMRKLWTSIILATVILLSCKKDSKQSLAVVSTATPTSITANTAQTGGTITSIGGSAVTQSGICWAIHNNPSLSDSVISSGPIGTGSFAISLVNLNANTTYYVRTYVVNGVGTAYGNTDSFVTAKGLPTVSTIAVSNIKPLTAQSGGNVSNDGGSPVIAKGICWSTSAHPTITNFKTSDGTGIGSFIDSLVNLASQTQYHVRVYATNSLGTVYGNEVNFTSSPANTVSDIDGNVYPYIQIGTQAWMTMNLKTTRYQNGDSIINGLKNFIWNTKTGAYTFPNGDSINNSTYGKLYNTYVLEDVRNVCPAGWHIPSDTEWINMEVFEGMSLTSADSVGSRGIIGAKFMTGGSLGLNLSLGGAILQSSSGSYFSFGIEGYYGSSTITTPGNNFYRGFNLGGEPGPIYRAGGKYGVSVRCVKN